jgi:hypothetical protein
VKSVPDTVLSVEHVISSLPVTVKDIDAVDAVDDDTLNVTVGAVVSTLWAELAEIAECVIVAALFEESLIVPEFNSSALAPTARPSVSVSPAAIVYEKTIEVVPVPEA